MKEIESYLPHIVSVFIFGWIFMKATRLIFKLIIFAVILAIIFLVIREYRADLIVSGLDIIDKLLSPQFKSVIT